MSEKCDYTIPVEIAELKFFNYGKDFILESGEVIKNLTIGYHTFGQLNESKDNVIWVCHALTANSDVSDWWNNLFGVGKILDPEKYFIICANVIGSCYGSTGPRSVNPDTGQAYGLDFPLVTIKDWAQAHLLLANHLQIDKIHLAIGGSGGGHQVLELCLIPDLKVEHAILLVCSAKETPWSIAIHESQRMCLEASPDFFSNEDHVASKALEAARAIGIMTYRTYHQFLKSQNDDDGRFKDFKAQSYMRYQGSKLSKRFYSHCYYSLLKSLDTHNIGRNRNGCASALEKINSKCLIISIDSDLLIPVSEQKLLSDHIPNAMWKIISSDYGHDGFLIEHEQITKLVNDFLS